MTHAPNFENWRVLNWLFTCSTTCSASKQCFRDLRCWTTNPLSNLSDFLLIFSLRHHLVPFKVTLTRKQKSKQQLCHIFKCILCREGAGSWGNTSWKSCWHCNWGVKKKKPKTKKQNKVTTTLLAMIVLFCFVLFCLSQWKNKPTGYFASHWKVQTQHWHQKDCFGRSVKNTARHSFDNKCNQFKTAPNKQPLFFFFLLFFCFFFLCTVCSTRVFCSFPFFVFVLFCILGFPQHKVGGQRDEWIVAIVTNSARLWHNTDESWDPCCSPLASIATR